MNKKLFLISLAVLLAFPLRAQPAGIMGMVSPKLRQLLVDHPPVVKELTNAVAAAFTNRMVQIYYFYTDNELNVRYYHYYPAQNQVVVAIRENQEAADEFICLFFELLNSQNEKSFEKICERARTGDISRDDFADEILKVEFKSVIKTRDLLGSLGLNEREILTSHYYNLYKNCPDKFEDYLVYSKRVSPDRDIRNEYKLKFDTLRQDQ